MQSKENWYPVQRPEDYHFPGVFLHNHSKRMGYSEDITVLPNCVATDPDFMYKDIQIGKGKAWGIKEIAMIAPPLRRAWLQFIGTLLTPRVLQCRARASHQHLTRRGHKQPTRHR